MNRRADILRSRWGQVQEASPRFIREARAASGLRDPGLRNLVLRRVAELA